MWLYAVESVPVQKLCWAMPSITHSLSTSQTHCSSDTFSSTYIIPCNNYGKINLPLSHF